MGITIGYDSYYTKYDKYPETKFKFTNKISKLIRKNTDILKEYDISYEKDVQYNLNNAAIIARKIFKQNNIKIEVESNASETFLGKYIKIYGVNQWLAYGWSNDYNYNWENSQLIKTQNAKPFFKIHTCIIEVLEKWLDTGLINEITDETGYYPGHNVDLLVCSKARTPKRSTYIEDICSDHKYLKQFNKEFELFCDLFKNKHPITTVDDFSILFITLTRLNDISKQNSYIIQSKDLDFLNFAYHTSNPLFNHYI